tara:strand:- start:1015 stop:1287 length:273 start_codon:yes stop_codon:yes gene_type:complete
MHRCDCKYKIMRQIAAYRDEIIKTIDTPHTSAGMIAEDAASKSAIFSPVSMVWPSYAEKPSIESAPRARHSALQDNVLPQVGRRSNQRPT